MLLVLNAEEFLRLDSCGAPAPGACAVLGKLFRPLGGPSPDPPQVSWGPATTVRGAANGHGLLILAASGRVRVAEGVSQMTAEHQFLNGDGDAFCDYFADP
jgi:hypothetical protein